MRSSAGARLIATLASLAACVSIAAISLVSFCSNNQSSGCNTLMARSCCCAGICRLAPGKITMAFCPDESLESPHAHAVSTRVTPSLLHPPLLIQRLTSDHRHPRHRNVRPQHLLVTQRLIGLTLPPACTALAVLVMVSPAATRLGTR